MHDNFQMSFNYKKQKQIWDLSDIKYCHVHTQNDTLLQLNALGQTALGIQVTSP